MRIASDACVREHLFQVTYISKEAAINKSNSKDSTHLMTPETLAKLMKSSDE
jgi:hypothetical protein